jgi:transposase
MSRSSVRGNVRRDGPPLEPTGALAEGELLIALHSVRSERQFCERLNDDLLFRCFLHMSLDETVWDQSTFAKNRDG